MFFVSTWRWCSCRPLLSSKIYRRRCLRFLCPPMVVSVLPSAIDLNRAASALSATPQVRQEPDVVGLRAPPVHQHHRLQLRRVVYREHGSHRCGRDRRGHLHLQPSGGKTECDSISRRLCYDLYIQKYVCVWEQPFECLFGGRRSTRPPERVRCSMFCSMFTV